MRDIYLLQRGCVSRRQLYDAGLTSGVIERRVQRGWLTPVHPGVFNAFPDAKIPLAAETAALLACGDRAVLSHDSAAALWELCLPSGAIHVTVAGQPSVRPHGVHTHRSRTLLTRDVAIRKELPVTSPARALLDIAGRRTPRQLELALDEGMRNGIVSRADIRDVLNRNPNRRGQATLRRLLDLNRRETVTRSKAEERFLALVREATLPAPDVNVWLEGFMVDFLWRRERIVVEVDGYTYHGSRLRFEEDRSKGAVLSAAGFQVIRVTWRQMEDEPYAVIARLAQALARAQAKAA
jgi:very-short-patch-repair endonuclease